MAVKKREIKNLQTHNKSMVVHRNFVEPKSKYNFKKKTKMLLRCIKNNWIIKMCVSKIKSQIVMHGVFLSVVKILEFKIHQLKLPQELIN